MIDKYTWNGELYENTHDFCCGRSEISFSKRALNIKVGTQLYVRMGVCACMCVCGCVSIKYTCEL